MNNTQARKIAVGTNRLIPMFICCLVATISSAQESGPDPATTGSQAQEQQPAKDSGILHVAAKDAIKHVGETIAVCGTVASGVYNRRSQTKNTYLNFDKPFPDNTFTAIIARRNRKHFKYKPEKLEGQWICTYGLITSYQGKAEVSVVIPEQIVAKEYPE